MDPKDYAIASAMVEYGGGFVKTLGHLAVLADADNLVRIKAAWPEYWKKYEALVPRLTEKK